MKCTDLLIQDHKAILRCLDILEAMAARVDHGFQNNPEDVETALRFLRLFGDEYHQTREESALFPVLMRTSAAQQRPLRQMLFEHDQERSLVEGLEDALRSGKGIDFVHYANRLSALLRNHIYKEENILFDVIEKSLSKEQDETVSAEFDRFHVPAGFDSDLHHLEWKYLRKTA